MPSAVLFCLLLFHGDRDSVSQRHDGCQQLRVVGQFKQVFPHPLVDRAVPAFHGEAGFDDVAVLQHVVGDQYAVLIKDTQDFRQEVDVLSS